MAKTPTAAEAAPPDASIDAATVSGQDETTVDPGADATPEELQAQREADAAEAAKLAEQATADAAADVQARADAAAAAEEAERLAAEEATRLAAEETARQDAEKMRQMGAQAEAKARAEADADAKHQSKVQKKAAADAKAAVKAAARNEAARAGRLNMLNDLLTVVEMGNLDHTRDRLLEALAADHAAQLDDDIFSLADITVIRVETLHRTLADWCMQARFAIMALA